MTCEHYKCTECGNIQMLEKKGKCQYVDCPECLCQTIHEREEDNNATNTLGTIPKQDDFL